MCIVVQLLCYFPNVDHSLSVITCSLFVVVLNYIHYIIVHCIDVLWWLKWFIKWVIKLILDDWYDHKPGPSHWMPYFASSVEQSIISKKPHCPQSDKIDCTSGQKQLVHIYLISKLIHFNLGVHSWTAFTLPIKNHCAANAVCANNIDM